jgi:UPF0271 protein
LEDDLSQKNKPDKIKKKNSSKQIYVLDASAIYNGVLGQNIIGLKYIPECVLSEIRGMLRGEAIIEEALLYEDLKITSPNKNSVNKIKKYATETGDIQELSQCDLSVIAIAMDLISQEESVMILSDDYDIQNLAIHIGLSCRGIHWKGITKIHSYQWKCPACGAISDKKISDCIECGTKMVKKTLRKKIRKKGGL